MNAREALSRLANSKRTKKLVAIVEQHIEETYADHDRMLDGVGSLTDQIARMDERDTQLYQRLKNIAALPNGSAKNQLNRLIAEMEGKPIPEEDVMGAIFAYEAANPVKFDGCTAMDEGY